MSEWLAGVKVSLISASVVGGAISMNFMDMPWKRRVIAVGSGAVMAHYIGEPVASFSGLPIEPTGFLIGLFGVSICHMIFEGIKHSDVSVKIDNIIAIFRRG